MIVSHDYGKVRIVRYGTPLDLEHDIVVEWLKGDQWELYLGFNSLSDNYDFTNVHAAAGQALAMLASE